MQKINGTAVIDFNLNTSMFNLAYGAPQGFTPETVDQVKQAFGGRLFAWWLPSTQRDLKLTQYLLCDGFTCENAEHAMISALNTEISAQKTHLKIKPVTDFNLSNDFVSVLKPYVPYALDFYGLLDEKNLIGNE